MISFNHQNDAVLENLWSIFSDFPCDDEHIEVAFLHFPAGTHREEIWHWFDNLYSKGVYSLMYGGSRMTVQTQLDFAKESLEAMLLTDEELATLTHSLFCKLKEKEVLHFLKEEFAPILKRDGIKFEDTKALRKFMMYDDAASEELYDTGINYMIDINWDWIYEELQK